MCRLALDKEVNSGLDKLYLVNYKQVMNHDHYIENN